MAAYHISTLPNSQQRKLLKSTFWTVRYYNTWIMYAGITSGNSFALKHFLSGNWFKLTSWLFGTSISTKLLGNKIKCLHVFQCLAETKDDRMISLVRGFFQDQVIDLSCQTLLPRDLNTLGFFLTRSLNKKWRELNLGKCNIGSNGCKTLSKITLDKSAHHIVGIENVNLSYNQLNYFSFVDVLKSWGTRKIIINDSSILESTSSSDLFESLVNAFIYCNAKTSLKIVFIGSFTFAYNLNEDIQFLDSSVIYHESLYLPNCSFSEKVNLLASICQNRPVNIHILETHVNKLTARGDMLFNYRQVRSLYVYDTTMSDEVADEIGRLIMTNYYFAGIMLVISKSKVRGTIITCSLSNELSNLELLNLIVKVKSLQYHTLTSWNNNLYFHCHRSEAIIQWLFDLVLNFTCQMKLVVIEGDTLIAHKAKFRDIITAMSTEHFLTTICLNCCNLSDAEYEEVACGIYYDAAKDLGGEEVAATFENEPLSFLLYCPQLFKRRLTTCYAIKEHFYFTRNISSQ